MANSMTSPYISVCPPRSLRATLLQPKSNCRGFTLRRWILSEAMYCDPLPCPQYLNARILNPNIYNSDFKEPKIDIEVISIFLQFYNYR